MALLGHIDGLLGVALGAGTPSLQGRCRVEHVEAFLRGNRRKGRRRSGMVWDVDGLGVIKKGERSASYGGWRHLAIQRSTLHT